MTKNDWQDAGDQFKRLIQDAVDSNDFSRLGSTLTNVVNDTVNGLQAALQENLSKAQQAGTYKTGDDGENASREQAGRGAEDRYQHTNSEAAERIRRNLREKREAEAKRARERAARTQDGRQGGSMAGKKGGQYPARYRAPGEISGSIMKWTGYSMGGMFGLSLAVLCAVGVTTGAWLMLPIGILLVLFGSSMVLGAGGSRKTGLARRFRRYMAVLGDRTYCLIEELASSVGESSRFVKKDLKKMINRGFFKEGYLDGKETLLITDRSTYQQYLSAQTEYERRRMAEEAGGGAFGNSAADSRGGTSQRGAAEAARGGLSGKEMPGQSENGPAARDTENNQNGAAEAGQQGDYGNKNLTPECREILEEGRRYIRHIQQCNERIPGEEISAKLDRLELVVTRIFREMEKDPSIAPELKKLMSYYLPTTTKLLDAYCEMQEQPIVGRNIESTKKEIEDALDTINTAFENLLDSLFQDEAWDISSEITVLHTMLAQEGLAGSDFAQKQGGK